MDDIKIIKCGNSFRMDGMPFCNGELMSVTVNQPEKFHTGEVIQCQCGDLLFEAKILQKTNKQIFFHAPLFHARFSKERRKLPRILVDLNTHIEHDDFPVENEVKVIDLNMLGFGILTTEPLKKDSLYFLHVDLGESIIKPQIIIRNELVYDEGFRYGCEIHSMTNKEWKALREFIITKQLMSIQPIVH